VAERWVVNASPVILLAKAEIIGLLPNLCDELVVPAGVLAEIENTDVTDAAVRWLRTGGGKFVKPVGAIHSALVMWRGGVGEAEVISWALLNPGFTAILDDRAARSFAARNGVAVLGSLRVIVIAKNRGFIPKARPALERLRGAGAYVSDELIDRAIILAGETPSR
jgi:predicted nucleic acid-binding protein